MKVMCRIENFYPNNPNFQKKIQKNLFFRLFSEIPHFEKVTPDQLAPTLKHREVEPIGLASALSAANPIVAYVLIYKGDANWLGACVCFIIFFEKHYTV